MNTWRTLLILFFFTSLISTVTAQTFNGEWICEYATIDDRPNGTGYNVPSVGVIKENTFVALVRRGTNQTCYLVGYADADSVKGRLGVFGYGGEVAGLRQQWSSGFDAVEMLEAVDIAATSDSLIFCASNDVDRNILVFKMTADTVVTTDYRLVTGADSIWAIDVDNNGYVYVTSIKDQSTASEVLVFPPVSDNVWMVHTGTPLQTITAPEPGELRGVTVNGDGTVLYISNYQTEKVYCYTGSPTTGYTQYTGFELNFTDWQDSAAVDPGPWGLGFMETKNILFMAASASFQTGAAYAYGKIFAINPNTGAYLDTIDVAEWNLELTGSYQTRGGDGNQGTVSGYASVYNVDFDENFNLYDQSNYGWTVDKWNFTGELPVIPLTLVGVEREENVLPSEFTLEQNYPNPFNPATKIKFAIPQTANVKLDVYSVNGELVTNLINSSQFEKGSYTLTFDASKLASGTYVYVLRYGDQQLSRKMTLIK